MSNWCAADGGEGTTENPSRTPRTGCDERRSKRPAVLRQPIQRRGEIQASSNPPALMAGGVSPAMKHPQTERARGRDATGGCDVQRSHRPCDDDSR